MNTKYRMWDNKELEFIYFNLLNAHSLEATAEVFIGYARRRNRW